jgi:hypothetical protein
MISLRVNLLRAEELRYQGAVSREFAVKMSFYGGGTLLALLGIIAFVNARISSGQLATSRSAWADIEPRYERVRALQGELAKNNQVSGDLESWSSTRVNWHEQLHQLRSLVPPEIQLTEMSVRGEWQVIVEGEKENEKRIPARQFTLRLEGRVSGDRADEVVVQLVDRMRADEKLSTALESVKLQGLQRSTRAGAGDGTRVFGIEGASYLRRME